MERKADYWCSISSYVYDKEMINEILLENIRLLNRNKEKLSDCIIQKRWVYGPHIRLLFKGKELDNKVEVESLFETRTKDITARHTHIQVQIDYELQEKLSNKVALLENYQGEYLPLKEHLSVSYEQVDLSKVDTIYDLNTYIQLEKLKTKFLMEIYEYYYELPPRKRDIFLMKLMIILTDYFDQDDFQIGGIKYGYLTYKSHYEGFMVQLKGGATNQRILEKLNGDYPELKEFAELAFPTFLQELREDLVSYKESDKEYLISWKEITKEMIDIFRTDLGKNKVQLNEYQTIERFLKSERYEDSKFHKTVFASEDFQDYFGSEKFLKHRFSINTFYSMLPMLGISPLHKHVLCRYVAEAVETYFNIDYNKVIEEIMEYM